MYFFVVFTTTTGTTSHWMSSLTVLSNSSQYMNRMTSFTLIHLLFWLLCFIDKSFDSLHPFFLFSILFKRNIKWRIFFIKNMIHFEIYYINMIHFLMNLKYIYIINFLYLLLLILFISSCIISPFRLNNLIPHWVIVTDITFLILFLWLILTWLHKH